MSEVRGQAPVQHQKDLIIDKCEEIKFVENLNDDYFGTLSLLRLHPYVKYVGSKTIPTQFIQNFQKRLTMKHPNVFFYIKKAHTAQRIQNQAGSFNVFFEYNYSSLEEMLARRKDQNWHYPETELWTLMKEVCAGLKFLMDQNIHHGEIKKQSIFFDDEYLLYRIYDNYLINADKYYQYQKNNQSLLLDNGTPPPEFSSYEYIQFKNTFKVDVWNFGLIILECATLSNVAEIVYLNGQLQIQGLNQLLQSLSGKYSPQFTNALLQMLDPDPRTRFDWQLLQKYLASEPIANQQPPYQTEPTQLHPSRSLMNLHEIVVGAQPQNSKTNMNSASENASPNHDHTPQSVYPKGMNYLKEDSSNKGQFKTPDQFSLDFKMKAAQGPQQSGTKFSTNTSSTEYYEGLNMNENQAINNALGEKDKQNAASSINSTSSSQSQAVNQRLILLNKKIQDTLIQSQKKTKKLTQIDKK